MTSNKIEEKLNSGSLKLGIIAGGQLAKMLIQEASKWDISTYVLDLEENCPASSIATRLFTGSRFDYNAVYQFGKNVDLLTYEIESINVDALMALQLEGIKLVPDPAILELIQDKGKQKDFYSAHQIPTANYKIYFSKKEITDAIEAGKIKFPFVQKICKGGYDGRGVAVINGTDDLNKLFEGKSIVEDKIDIAKELSVIVARNESGEIKCFPPVEMIFDAHANLLDKLICPAEIGSEVSKEAQNIAYRLIDSLKMAGLLAIEFFIDKNNRLYVNESAPRPHNSGHHSIESEVTSQYEQHLRAILNLPLGNTDILRPSVMINLLGEPNYTGPVRYEGLREVLDIEGVKIHLYGKKITQGYRKMGHITILADTIKEALEKANRVKQLIKVKSWDKNQ
jgi:5-(carboxyamino)imidazole ribonucleotide synthase